MGFSSEIETRRASFALGGRPLAGPLLALAGVLLSLPIFWYGFASLVDAWAVPEYSHGPIIPLISTFLFLRDLRHIPPSVVPITDRWPGIAVLALGLLIGVMGNLTRIPDIVTYAFLVWLGGMILITLGWRRGILLWPGLVHLSFMLPLPQFVYWQISIYLQGVSSEIGVALIMLFNIPVYLDGNIIDLGIYKLQVAEACSGLRYLFPMLSFSFVFAILYQGPKWHKVLLLLAAAPITVLMNSFRIGVIGILVNSYGIEHAEGFLHTFEGWIIFIACVVILFGLASLLQQLTRHPRPLSETLDIEFAGLDTQLARALDIVPSRALGVAVVLTALVSAATLSIGNRPSVVPDRQAFEEFPLRLGPWSGGAPQRLDSEIAGVLGADDYLSQAFFADSFDASVDLFMAYYHRQTEGSGIHSPEVCIPVGGWEVSAWAEREVVTENGTVTVNRALIRRGVSRQLVYFWFEQRGRRATSDYVAKAMTVSDSLTRGRTDGGLVRVITPLGAQESEAAGDRRLEAFIGDLLPAIGDFIPE